MPEGCRRYGFLSAKAAVTLFLRCAAIMAPSVRTMEAAVEVFSVWKTMRDEQERTMHHKELHGANVEDSSIAAVCLLSTSM